MSECIFCKIIEGKIPSYTVYEDEMVIAFLDINPAAIGHTLVIPRKHSENIYDIDRESLNEIMKTAQKIANHYKTTLNCTNVQLIHSAGRHAQQEVMHFHLHIVPRFENDLINLKFAVSEKAKNFEEILAKIKM